MMTPEERFRHAIEVVLKHEGGFSVDPADDGGAPNMGISSVHHPDVDVRSLTRERAIELYRTRYWERYRINEIDDPSVAAKVLDLCIWMGPDDAARYLQTAINAVAGSSVVVIDGIIGSKTLAAVRQSDPRGVLTALRALALEHVYDQVRDDPTERRFLKGWERRALA